MVSQDNGIQSFVECVSQKEVITFSRLWEECTQEEDRLIIRDEKMGATEDQSSHDSKKILQATRNMEDSILEEPLIHLGIWIRNDAIMNVEDDEAEGSRRSLPTKQIKISIQLSFHDIVLLCICLYSVDVLCMFEYLHLYY